MSYQAHALGYPPLSFPAKSKLLIQSIKSFAMKLKKNHKKCDAVMPQGKKPWKP